jgi:hypothetical protein
MMKTILTLVLCSVVLVLSACGSGEVGDDCESDSDCESTICVYSTCSAGETFDYCIFDTDCVGGRSCIEASCQYD